MPFYSVVIPTFNQAKYLNKAMRSVLNQTYKDFEVIIVDNYSTDETQKIIKKFKSKKVKTIKFQNKGIIGASRNAAIKISKGKWIAFLDSDDMWHPNKLKIIFDEIKKNKNIKVFCSNEILENMNNKKKKIWFCGPYTNHFYENLLNNGNCIATSASVVNKDILEKEKIFFNEKKKFVTAEDFDFFLNIARKRYKFKFLDKILGKRLVHSNSMSSRYELHKTAVNSVYKKHAEMKFKNVILQKLILFRFKFSVKLVDLNFYLIKKKDYFRSFYLIFYMIIFYPDKSLKLFLKKIKLYIYNYKYRYLLKQSLNNYE